MVLLGGLISAITAGGSYQDQCVFDVLMLPPTSSLGQHARQILRENAPESKMLSKIEAHLQKNLQKQNSLPTDHSSNPLAKSEDISAASSNAPRQDQQHQHQLGSHTTTRAHSEEPSNKAVNDKVEGVHDLDFSQGGGAGGDGLNIKGAQQDSSTLDSDGSHGQDGWLSSFLQKECGRIEDDELNQLVPVQPETGQLLTHQYEMPRAPPAPAAVTWEDIRRHRSNDNGPPTASHIRAPAQRAEQGAVGQQQNYHTSENNNNSHTLHHQAMPPPHTVTPTTWEEIRRRRKHGL